MSLIKNYLQKKFVKLNTSIAKKDFFYGVLFSPVFALILVNFAYSIKTISLYFDNSNQFSSQEVVLQLIPFLLGGGALLNYSYNMYKYKCFYMSVIGSLIIRSLIFVLFLLVGSFIFAKSNILMIAAAMFLNFVIIMISWTYGSSDMFANSHDNEPMCFKLVFIDKNLGKVTTFIKNINIVYYSEYVMFGDYKINYRDVSIIESEFNKKLYDFNNDELKIVEMYAIN